MTVSRRRSHTCRFLLAFALAAAACGPDATTGSEPLVGGNTGSSGGAGGTAPPPTGGAGPAPSTGGVALPMSVTAQFQNQGWFADPSVEMFFAGGMVIRQVDGTTGPCAARLPQVRGKCVKVTYTPPDGLVPPPTGGWVGVYFLTTANNDHPEATPPVRVGEANWGIEPGLNIAPGATKISFLAAADEEGVAVSFKAGTDKDTFTVQEQRQVLGTAWKRHELPVSGVYGSSVIGGFAWVLGDTTRPATFYLDNIVWE